MISENKEEKRVDFIVAKEGCRPLILSPEKLSEMVAKGEIKGDDLIFRESIKVWTRARFVKGLRSLIARVEANSTNEVDDSGKDFLDELLNEPDVPEEKYPNNEKHEYSKNTELPPILAAAVAARNENKGLTNERVSRDTFTQAIDRMQSGEVELPDSYPEINLPHASTVKNYVQYGIIGSFLLVLLYYFYPSSRGEVIRATEYVHGKISMNGEPLKYGSVVATGPGGNEVYGVVESGGTYRIESPPKGMLKLKLVAFPLPPPNLDTSKKDAKGKAKILKSPLIKYQSFENEIAIDYQGGKKLFDLNLGSK